MSTGEELGVRGEGSLEKRSPLEAQSDYWSRLEKGCAPTFPIVGLIGECAEQKRVLAWFSDQSVSPSVTKRPAHVSLGQLRRYALHEHAKGESPIPHLALFDTRPRKSIPNGRGVLLKPFAKN